MNATRMPLEAVLILVVAVVWAALAAVYQFSPSLGMPGYVRVWGAGALVFVGLGAALMARRRPPR